eukprot:TRINITY_DN1228_c0_g1_i1.p1 TRINITY_DN1228_c0_g1~~TRINITY_DN1228_c0_g1_i1.p1  ORF type:complete len:312 (+),score=87.22 TRINITY_DN1228_c0_g1_i1:85-1020(+)
MTRMFFATVAALLGLAAAVTPEELESYFYSTSGLDLSRAEAHTLAMQEADSLTKCGVTVSDIKALAGVLYSTSYIDMSKAEIRQQLLPLAKQHIDPEELKNMWTALYSTSSLDLSKSECKSRSIELTKYRAEPDQVKALYDVLYRSINLPKTQAQSDTLELAAAGCDPKALEASYKASRDLNSAKSSALRANLNGEAKRYAKDGKAYTLAEFQQYYGKDYFLEWLAAPAEKRVANDYKAYTASEFRMFFGSSWESKFIAGLPATQMRIAEDGKIYDIAEFVQYYKDSWQKKWAAAPEVPCKECHAAKEVVV